jgi:type I restriction enzyme M protein
VLFVKIAADGFDLGAQRKEIKRNDLPEALDQIQNYKDAIASRDVFDAEASVLVSTVSRKVISENGDYNLSSVRYRAAQSRSHMKWPLVKLRDICEIVRGGSPRPINDYLTDDPEGVNWIKIGDASPGSKFITQTAEKITREGAKKSRLVKPGDFILSNSMSFGRPYIMAIEGYIHDGWLLLREQTGHINKDYLYYILGSDEVRAQFEQASLTDRRGQC